MISIPWYTDRYKLSLKSSRQWLPRQVSFPYYFSAEPVFRFHKSASTEPRQAGERQMASFHLTHISYTPHEKASAFVPENWRIKLLYCQTANVHVWLLESFQKLGQAGGGRFYTCARLSCRSRDALAPHQAPIKRRWASRPQFHLSAVFKLKSFFALNFNSLVDFFL